MLGTTPTMLGATLAILGTTTTMLGTSNCHIWDTFFIDAHCVWRQQPEIWWLSTCQHKTGPMNDGTEPCKPERARQLLASSERVTIWGHISLVPWGPPLVPWGLLLLPWRPPPVPWETPLTTPSTLGT